MSAADEQPGPARDPQRAAAPDSAPGAAPFVSRAGAKLDAALRSFGVDVAGLVCADFGSHAGGFVDCLLRRGAARVYAIDPGYGVLDYRLRRDPRVVVCERTNALRWLAPEPCDLVTIDVGWTPQRLILPSARRALRTPTGRVVTLVKPHYEADKAQLRDGVLLADALPGVLRQVRADCAAGHWSVRGEVESPLAGHAGNREFLWLLVPAG
jgi:23S rRNA (cytidine1920-2'-O)/16S rRNA (cytidine1409-2'-O)-methyltransferase